MTPLPAREGQGVGGAEGARGADAESSLRSHPPLAPPWGGGEGSESFTNCAARLAGLGGWLLGWRPEEFWTATPSELAAVLGAMGPADPAASLGDLARLMEMFPDG